MLKPKHVDISQTNIANLGTDLEKKVREAAAGHEDAWKGSGQHEGIEIWRIEKFHVKPWPKQEYGKFFLGDSYIVLKTKKVNDKLAHDIHFWLGTDTTQDEAGTAAYKTVELDDYHHQEPIEHREVAHYESALFRSYFPQVLYLQGGIETGFKHVGAKEYKPRLLHLKGKKRVKARQVDLTCDSLNDGDVFILDNGLTIYQWNGSKSGGLERAKGAELSRAIDDGEREGKAQVVVLDHKTTSDTGSDMVAFYNLLGGHKKIKEANEVAGDDIFDQATGGEKKLFRLSDASGKLEFTEVATGNNCTKDKLKSSDVFILDAGAEIIAWVGSGSSTNERKNALGYAQSYLDKAGKPAFLPISRVYEGGENEVIKAFMSW